MKLQDTKSLVPFFEYSPLFPSIYKAERNHGLSLERQGNGRLFKLGDEVKGVYGPHGREALTSTRSKRIDIYI